MHQTRDSFEPYDGDMAEDSAIAIVGMSCRFANVRTLKEYWTLLSEGREAGESYSEDQLLAAGVSPALLRNPNYVRSGKPLSDMECFDAGLFGLSPRDASIMDPQHRHFLECSWEALENAGHTPKGFGGVIGVFAGSGHNAHMPYNLLTNSRLVEDTGLFLLRHTSNDKDFLSTRLSYLLDLRGPSINVQTACSTSMVAIHMAVQSLLGGECDMAIAGAATIELPHRQGYLFEAGEILSPDGHCRPFDVNSKGTVFGSGVAVLVLRRLENAIADGDHIHAVIRGSAINNDGASKAGYLAPSVDGQAMAIAEALAVAGVDPATVTHVETHGTGTPIGDPIEIAALTQVFRQSTDQVGQCSIGSVKANIGHTDTAAGAAGVIKVALSMTHGELPPVPNFTSPNPDCALEDSPFKVQAVREPWKRVGNIPRRAGVSSLGVGGTNAHVVLEEAPPRVDGDPGCNRQLLVCSGASASAADANALALARHLDDNPDTSLADAAYTLSTGRTALKHRRFAVGANAAEAAASLRAASQRAVAAQPCVPGRSVAFMFCGAGPGHVDMARGLYENEPAFRSNVDIALSRMAKIGVPELGRWLFPTEEDRGAAAKALSRPSVALPALFIIQTALAKLWISKGVEPSAMIGHSSGEYAAAYIAGVIDMEAGLRIVHARGRLFEKTASGAMLSVALGEDDLLRLLPPGLSIAAINAPALCIVSGAAETIMQFGVTLTSKEIEFQPVPISVAAHSAMLDPILDEFRSLLHTVSFLPPSIPFASNLTGSWVRADEAVDPDYWVRHLRQPVRFTDGLQCVLEKEDVVLLEVGPGRSMTSLARQHPARRPSQPSVNSMRHPDEKIPDETRFLEALGELWALGAEPDWHKWWEGEKRLKIQLPTYQFDRQRHWIEPGASLYGASGEADIKSRRATKDWGYEPFWQREDLLPTERKTGPALVLADDTGFAQDLVRQLREGGTDVITVRAGKRPSRTSDTFTVRPGQRPDWANLFAILAAEDRLPQRVFHCWLLTGPFPKLAKPPRMMNLGLHDLLALAPELSGACDEREVSFALVTDGAERVGSDALIMPAKATAIAALRVVASEYRNLSVSTMDLDVGRYSAARTRAGAVRAVINELDEHTLGNHVALRAGERWVREYRPVRMPDANDGKAEAEAPVAATYLIAGGLGGLGLAVARHLAENRGARLILAGRSKLPPREKWAELLAAGNLQLPVEERIRKLLALEAMGAIVEIATVDITDARALRKVVRKAETRFGPITGVFQAAGILDDGLIEGRTAQIAEAVLRPKIEGTIALEQALRHNPPEFMVLFSSISAIAGIPGQVDYAAANAFLDSYAQSRRDDPVTRVISIGWSQWAEVGMAAMLARRGGSAEEMPGELEEGCAVDHPFLNRAHALSEDEIIVTGKLGPSAHWLLDEHRIAGGGALLPGTGYLELVRAAMAQIETGPLEFLDFTFLKPFVVPDGAEREVRVRLRKRAGDGWRAEVLGLPVQADPGSWVLHATGLVRSLDVPPTQDTFDIDAAAARCSPAVSAVDDQPMLQFGPRWTNLKARLLGADEALLQLELPSQFSGDLETLHLHPALLDIATAGAQQLIPGRDPARDFYAPFTYRRLALFAPLPAEIFSHVWHRTGTQGAGLTAAFDVTITDSEGRILAEISDFTMTRIPDAGLLLTGGLPASEQGGAVAGPAASHNFEGILPEEGMEVISQLIDGFSPTHLLVCPYELEGLLTRLAAPPAARKVVSSGSVDEPATEAERIIADIWSDLLGIDAIGRNDSFFDLGGHSLLAVQFTNKLRKKTGRTLPLAAMLGQPTVASLAGIFDPESRAVGQGNQDSELSPEPEGEVVTIRPGNSAQPLFFVHDGLGETLLYRGLALRLDPALPIMAFEPLRTAEGNFAHTRIDEMAANYIKRMRKVQPAGPYLLSGLCAGGVIAFEMARQLQGQGQNVAFVGIIDAADVQATRQPFLDWRLRIGRVKAMLSGSSIFAMAPALGNKAWNAVRWELESRLRRTRDKRAVRHLRQADPSASRKADISFLKLYEVAHLEHRPSGIFDGGMVALFKASQETGILDDTPYGLVYSDHALGWGKRVAGDITIYDVPGGHSSALQCPHVETLARVFQRSLDTALANARSHQSPEHEEHLPELASIAAE